MAYPSFPNIVYLDTSYLVRLLTYKRDPRNRKLKSCKLLYDHLLQSKTQLIGSLFTLEEAIYFLFFKLKLMKEAEVKGFQNVKQYRLRNPKSFQGCYNCHKGIPRMVLNESRALGIEFAHPRFTNPRLDTSKRIRQYAVGLLERYCDLDCKDAFHVAIARVLRIELMITCDRDFASVTEISSYNPLN